LAAQGYLPITYDNLSLGHRWAVKWGPLEEGNLLDGARIREVLSKYRIQAVMHFAASAYVSESMRDPAAYYRNNMLTTLNLLDAMRDLCIVQLIFSSSCSVYGNPITDTVDESHPLAPLSPYGQTKLDSENAIRWYAQAYGLRWLALRYFNAAGADPDGEIGECHEPETRLVPRAILAALGVYPPLQVFGTDYDTTDGTAVRDYVHVSDLASAHVKALQKLEGQQLGAVVNLGTGRGYTVMEVVKSVAGHSHREVPYSISPRRDGDPGKMIAAAGLAAGLLNWSPRFSDLKTIVSSAWKWHEASRVMRVAE
jgi:UDP-arabinose 4-epimerase